MLAGYRRFREICCIYVNFKGFKSREVQYTELLGCWIFYMLCVFREEEGLCRPDRLSNARVRIRGRLGVGSGKEELLSFSGSADISRPPTLNLFTCKWELGIRCSFRNVPFFFFTQNSLFSPSTQLAVSHHTDTWLHVSTNYAVILSPLVRINPELLLQISFRIRTRPTSRLAVCTIHVKF